MGYSMTGVTYTRINHDNIHKGIKLVMYCKSYAQTLI